MPGKAGQGRWILAALGGVLERQQWPVQKPLLLGRAPECDVFVPVQQVSRRHARVWPQEGALWVEDLGSKNGTFLNGEPLQPHQPQRMKEGDILALALAQKFVVLGMGETATQPVPEPLQAAMRRFLQEPRRRLTLDPESQTVWVLGRRVEPPLSPQQFRLLEALYRQAGRVVSRSALIEAVWGEEAPWVTHQALDVLVHRVRERLAAYDPVHRYVVTVRGRGLRLDNPPWPHPEPHT